jgi:tetratricopeptide (TPR) repeat protein
VERAKALDEDHPEVLLAEGFLYYRANQDYDRALKIFEDVKRVRPNLPYTYLANIQRQQGKWDESLQNLERSFSFNPRSADLAYQIGNSYIHLRQYEQAVEWCNRSIAIDSDYYFPYLAKVRVALLGRGNVSEAHRISETIPQHQYSDYIWFLLSVLERDYAGALERLSASAFESFVGQDFYVPKSLLMASVYKAMGDQPQVRMYAEQAREELQPPLLENPEDPRLNLSLAIAQALLGNKPEAISLGRSAVDSCPLESDAFAAPRYLMGLAEIYVNVNEFEQAIRLLDRLLSIPCGNILSIHWLRIDPTWDPIRQHPDFLQMLRKHQLASSGEAP